MNIGAGFTDFYAAALMASGAPRTLRRRHDTGLSHRKVFEELATLRWPVVSNGLAADPCMGLSGNIIPLAIFAALVPGRTVYRSPGRIISGKFAVEL
jgi:hypothetical protein